MAYIYQTFSSGQVFTKGQAQQTEDNIRDHIHGANGLGAAGMSFNPSSATSTFTVTQTNAAQNIDLSGSFQVDFNSAATLGTSFGAAFTNIGSGRIVLAAAAGQFIGTSSIFILTPGEFIGIGSDGAKLKTFGKVTGDFLLHNEIFSGSTAFIRTTQFPWFSDFSEFRMQIDVAVSSLVTTTSPPLLQWSNTSGTNFATSGFLEYNLPTGAATTNRNGVLINFLAGASPGVYQDIGAAMTFRKASNTIPSSQAQIIHIVDAISRSALVTEYNYQQSQVMLGITGSASSIAISANAFRFHAGNTGAYISNGALRIWGKR